MVSAIRSGIVPHTCIVSKYSRCEVVQAASEWMGKSKSKLLGITKPFSFFPSLLLSAFSYIGTLSKVN